VTAQCHRIIAHTTVEYRTNLVTKLAWESNCWHIRNLRN